jgi:hypothetical protein
MFRRKKKTAPHEGRKLTQKEIMSHIEQLSPGESSSYRLPEVYGSQLAIVEFNTVYPWRGLKYILSVQALVEGKPNGEKTLVLESDEAKDIAAWVSHHRGSSYHAELPVSNEKDLALGKREKL